MRRSLRFVSALAVGLVATVGLATPAFAEDQVLIRKVDTTNMPNVSLTVLTPTAVKTGTELKLSENGTPVTDATFKNASDAGLAIGTVIVLDTSNGANNNGNAFGQAKAAAIALVEAKMPNQQVGIVATGGASARIAAPLSTDSKALVDTINGLQASGDNSIWSGVSIGTTMLSANTALQPNVIVLAASKDTASPSGGFTKAVSDLATSKSVAFTVGLTGNVDTGNLQDAALETNGRYLSTNDPATGKLILSGLEQNLQDQQVVTYKSRLPIGKDGQSYQGAIDIVVGYGSGTDTARTSAGTVAEGNAVAPTVASDSKAPGFLGGWLGLVIVGIISLACVGLLLYGILEIVGTERNQLSSALRPYSDAPEEGRDFSKIADSEILKKAVAATAKAAEERGLLQVVERRLEQADLPFRPAEALFMVGIVALVAMLLGAIFFQFLGIVFAAMVFAVLPPFITGFLAKRRKMKFTRQLPDTLQLLAGSLRAGYSLVQGLDATSKQAEAPMGTELLRAMSEARLGRPVEETLQEISNRMGSEDFEWAVMAIKIQREVGGNLAELLMTVSETMIARERLRREVRALTAEGRISAIVLAGLPPIIGVIIAVINPTYMDPMLHNVLGQIALGAGVVMIVIGYWLMMKMIQVEA